MTKTVQDFLLTLQAANYLDIKGLLDVTTTHVAQIIVECRTPEKIRERFNIKNDLTPEDLEQVCLKLVQVYMQCNTCDA